MKLISKHLLAILWSSFVIASSVSCLSDPNATENSVPPIQTMITHLSSLSDNPDEDSEGRWQRLTYDRHGHVLENDGAYLPQEDSTLELEYDEKGNIIKSNWYGADGSLQRARIFRYDSCDNVISITTSDSGGWIGYPDGRQVIEYDTRGNATMTSTYASDDTLMRYTVSTYDGKDNCIGQVSYDFDGVPTGRTIHKYDEQGNRIETISYDEEGKLSWKTVNAYDNHGNRIESRGYEPDGSLAGKETYEYDSQGNVIETTRYSSHDDYSIWATVSITYLEFDEYGNWTRRVGSGTAKTEENGEVQDDSGEYAEYRTITYYEGTPDCKKGTVSSITPTPTPQPTPTDPSTLVPESKVYVIYEADISLVDDPAKAMKGLITVLENRLAAYGITEPEVARIGVNHLKVSLTGINGDDMEEAAALLGEPALIKFKEQIADENGNMVWQPATGTLTVKNEAGQVIEIEKELTSQYFEGEIEVALPQGGPVILFEWNEDGAKMFEQITRRLINKPLGIFLGDETEPIASPIVRSVITDRGLIEGIELGEAKRVAKLLNAGRLEIPLRIVEKGF